MKMNLLKTKGQVLLIVVLIMAVALTVGLAVASRSLTDISISRQEEESARAFSAAEAGIEQAVGQSLAIGGLLSGVIGGVDYSVEAVAQGVGTEFVFPQAIERGDTQSVWLVEHNASGQPDKAAGFFGGTSVDLYWGNSDQDPGVSSTPALEVTLIYESSDGIYAIKRNAFDPNAGRIASNNFNLANSGSYSLGGKTFRFRQTAFTIPAGKTPYLLRLKLLYNNVAQIVGVKASSNFPSQGKCYEARGTLTSSGVSRKVKQCHSYGAPTSDFDYAVFSENNLSK